MEVAHPMLELPPPGYWWRIRKLIHLRAFFGQAHESRLPRFGAWALREPSMHAAEIERGGREHLLEMDFLLTTVAGLS